VEARVLAEFPKNLMAQVEEAIHHSLGFSEETAVL
jgi:hypothetical protein